MGIKLKSVLFLKKYFMRSKKEFYRKCIADVKPYTMVSEDALYDLCKYIEYLETNHIEGDIVECGVWRGGCCLLMAKVLKYFKNTSRKIYLYDTFEGMSEPTQKDKRLKDESSAIAMYNKMHKTKVFTWGNTGWCEASLEDVKTNMKKAKYPLKNMIFIKGKVEETLSKTLPKKIALLRLDTDWYESTKYEMTRLYPLLVENGVFISDDYYYWAGCKDAIDEYFDKLWTPEFKKNRNVLSFIKQSKPKNKRIPSKGLIYQGREEIGLMNLDIRRERVFEYADMIETNKLIGKYFLNEAKSVVNIGSGVGTFEFYNADKYPNIKFLASEMDDSQTQWAKENRTIENVEFTQDSMNSILAKNSKFDLAITIDVIEHIKDYKSFLDEFSMLSDKAIITTPNRDRYFKKSDLITPPYIYHTQEFNAGEFYFILKMYYQNVKMYSIPDMNAPEFKEIGIYSTYDKLIAYCEK